MVRAQVVRGVLGRVNLVPVCQRVSTSRGAPNSGLLHPTHIAQNTALTRCFAFWCDVHYGDVF